MTSLSPLVLPQVSVIIPTRDEAVSIEDSVSRTFSVMRSSGYEGEVIVVDSKSSDRTKEIALSAGASVVSQPIPGYGAACIRGLEEARGDVIVLMDGDGTYDPEALPRFVEPILAGYDLVVGTRRNGNFRPGSMSGAHKHFWEPLQNWVFRRYHGLEISDVRCGMRALSKEAAKDIPTHAIGMEFAGEMLAASVLHGHSVLEVPVEFHPRPAGETRRSSADSWRQIRQVLLSSPSSLYFVPGGGLLAAGIAILLILLPGPLWIMDFPFNYHFMFVGSALVLLGLQLVILGIVEKTIALVQDPVWADRWIHLFHRWYTLEKGLWSGGVPLVLGIGIGIWFFIDWVSRGGPQFFAVRQGILALTLMITGAQVLLSALLISALRGKHFGRV